MAKERKIPVGKPKKSERVNEFGLIDRHQVFCEEYVISLNATQSAIKAGFSEKSARSQACELLTNPNIQAYIDHLRAEAKKRTQVDTDYVIGTLVKVCESAQEGKVKQRYDYKEKCFVTVEDDEGNAVWERDNMAIIKSSELLGKYLGIWKENVNLQNNGKDLPETNVSVTLTINHRRKGDKIP